AQASRVAGGRAAASQAGEGNRPRPGTGELRAGELRAGELRAGEPGTGNVPAIDRFAVTEEGQHGGRR
ncbi:MAG: hypothetical protein WAK82_05895, partial [Streptosporangiaceae bacterium]